MNYFVLFRRLPWGSVILLRAKALFRILRAAVIVFWILTATPVCRPQQGVSSVSTQNQYVQAGLDFPGETRENVESKRHAERIERGLLPVAIVRGGKIARMTLEERMRRYSVPGVSIAFFENGRIVWTRTYGFADVEKKIPITSRTLFEAGSVSKPTAGLAVLRLVQEGRLNLDADVNDELLTWKIPENEFTRKERVTVRRLLSHSAGVNVHSFEGYTMGEPIPNIYDILEGKIPANTPPVRVESIPGSEWSYSGGGFVVLQLLIADVTKKPFETALQEMVFGPAGMTQTTFEQPLPKQYWKSAATGYESNGKPVKGRFHVYPEMAAAGLWTNPTDLALMAIEIQKEAAGVSSAILNREMVREMLTPQMKHWGLGFSLGLAGTDTRFGHFGSDKGFTSTVQAFAKSGQGVAIMTNGDRGDQLIHEMLSAFAEEYHWPDFHPHVHDVMVLKPSELSLYLGTYKIPGQMTVTISSDGRQLFARMDPPDLLQEPEVLLPETRSQFFTTTDDFNFIFSGERQGSFGELSIKAGNDVFKAERIY